MVVTLLLQVLPRQFFKESGGNACLLLRIFLSAHLCRSVLALGKECKSK